MIEISSETALVTVQDQGRTTARRYGVGSAGAMDRLSLAVGNLLVGNDITAAGLEIPIFPFSLTFHEPMAFAITGADADARLGGRSLPPYWTATAQPGDSLSLRLPSSGAHAYLAFQGGLDLPEVLGSRSTQLRGEFGGLEGRALRKGDRLGCMSPDREVRPAELGVLPPSLALPLGEAGATTVRVLPTAEYEAFSAEARDRFWGSGWKITPQSNRAGYRLAGPSLELTAPLELRSHGIVPGVIQVPPGGQPIIQLADAATAGGYPKLGTVIDADLWRIGQARLGSELRFVEVGYADAVAALEEVDRYLEAAKASAALYRSAVACWGNNGC
jgi:biotin-dependent carboxylase-like uncharacterized protein